VLAVLVRVSRTWTSIGAAGDGDGGRGSAAVGGGGAAGEDGWIWNCRAGGKAGAAAASRVWCGGGAGLQQLAPRVGALARGSAGRTWGQNHGGGVALTVFLGVEMVECKVP
jgi:hypothetical protein